MLRDLFFYLYEYGLLQITVLVLFLLSLVLFCFIVIRAIISKKKLSKLGWFGIIISLLFMYQIVPVTFEVLANRAYSSDKYNKGAKYCKLAINTAIIPWQKGMYSYNYADLFAKNKEEVIVYLDKANSYIKTHKYDWSYMAGFEYYMNDGYDKAIEIFSVPKVVPLSGNQVFRNPDYAMIARCYLMKQDFDNAMIYVDKALEQKIDHVYTYAIKSYLEKRKGNLAVAEEYHQKALEFNEKSRGYRKLSDEKLEKMFNDPYKFALEANKKFREHREQLLNK